MKATRSDDELGNVYRRAIKVIQRQGWHQGGYSPVPLKDHGPVCIVGALDVASGRGVFSACIPADHWILRELVPDGYLTVWNDDPERTRRQVLAKLGQAARIVEAEEGQ